MFFEAAREILCLQISDRAHILLASGLHMAHLTRHFHPLWKTYPNTTQCHCLSEGNTDKNPKECAKAETELLPWRAVPEPEERSTLPQVTDAVADQVPRAGRHLRHALGCSELNL